MRSTKTLILRLYVDSEAPDRLCGNIQLPSEQHAISFKTDIALIRLLRQLNTSPPQNKSNSIVIVNPSDQR